MLKSKILFLYTEIAEYFLSGIEELNKRNVEIHIVRFPVNKEAPFSFREIDGVSFYAREKYTKKLLLALTKKIAPDIIIISGWTDNAYLKVASYYQNKIPVVLTFDNHWTGSLKQNIAKLLSPFFIKNKFSSVWVPGEPQKKYALNLGFNKSSIYTGFYSADTFLYSEYYKKYMKQKETCFPKKLLFVGKYIKEKAVDLLWEVFSEIQNEKNNDWELICVGVGTLFNKRVQHPKIKHLGFVQPKNMGKIISETGVFILPGNFEPWGVVIHEYAAAGFPLVCSNKIGAASAFLEENKNGFFFESGNKADLKKVLEKIMNLPSEKLVKMAKLSHKKSLLLSPEKWADTVISILKSKT